MEFCFIPGVWIRDGVILKKDKWFHSRSNVAINLGDVFLIKWDLLYTTSPLLSLIDVSPSPVSVIVAVSIKPIWCGILNGKYVMVSPTDKLSAIGNIIVVIWCFFVVSKTKWKWVRDEIKIVSNNVLNQESRKSTDLTDFLFRSDWRGWRRCRRYECVCCESCQARQNTGYCIKDRCLPELECFWTFEQWDAGDHLCQIHIVDHIWITCI